MSSVHPFQLNTSLVPRPPPFLFFGLHSVQYTLSASVYYTECKMKNKNRGGLGIRLTKLYMNKPIFCSSPIASNETAQTLIVEVLLLLTSKLPECATSQGVPSCSVIFSQVN